MPLPAILAVTVEVPRTRPVLTELSMEAVSDIEALMSYSEGGDDPCNGFDDALRDRPQLVDRAFREAEVLQVGWDYAVCWGVQVDGAGSLLVERGADLTADRCVTFVLDPPEAVARWGEIGETKSGASGYSFTNTAQMMVPACFAPP